MTKYEWQDSIWHNFKDNGYNGLLKALPGSGKTIGACRVIEEYKKEFPESRIWVTVPARNLISQWEDVLEERGIEDIRVQHYASASLNLERYLMGELEDDTPDFLICDEAHVLSSPQGTLWKNVINYGIPHILGLSATPSGADKLIGGIILEVDKQDSNLSDSINNLVLFTPTDTERENYDKATRWLEDYYSISPNPSFHRDSQYRFRVLNRIRVLNNMNSRLDIALHFVKKNLGKRTIVFFSTKKQVNAFEKILKSEGIECAIQVSGREEIEDFHPDTGTKDILLCIKMLEQGYNDPTLEVGIMASYDRSVTSNIQKYGRLLRPHEDKVAKIYYIIAENTSDENIIDRKNTIFPIGTTQVIRYGK